MMLETLNYFKKMNLYFAVLKVQRHFTKIVYKGSKNYEKLTKWFSGIHDGTFYQKTRTSNESILIFKFNQKSRKQLYENYREH